MYRLFVGLSCTFIFLIASFLINETNKQAALAAGQINRSAYTNQAPTRVKSNQRFGGLVQENHAALAAEVKAKLIALEKVLPFLAKSHLLQNNINYLEPLTLTQAEFLALAACCYSHKSEQAVIVNTFPQKEVSVVIHNYLRDDWENQIIYFLENTEKADTYTKVIVELSGLLSNYESYEENALQSTFKEEGSQELYNDLIHCVQKLQSTNAFFDSLEEIYSAQRDEETLKKRTEELITLDPSNPFILTFYAELHLLEDKTKQAQMLAEKALELLPEYAYAHDIRGMALLQQNLPSLAIQSFSHAIRYLPQQSTYYQHRAASYLLLEETNLMCLDLLQSCTLNECETLAVARENGYCLQ